jgi:hypothetical protein
MQSFIRAEDFYLLPFFTASLKNYRLISFDSRNIDRLKSTYSFLPLFEIHLSAGTAACNSTRSWNE